MDMEFIWKIRYMLDKSKSPTPNMMRRELKCSRALKQNKYIRILLIDKGISTVLLDDSEYLLKLNLLLESGVYEALPNCPTSAVKFGNSFQNTVTHFLPV